MTRLWMDNQDIVVVDIYLNNLIFAAFGMDLKISLLKNKEEIEQINKESEDLWREIIEISLNEALTN